MNIFNSLTLNIFTYVGRREFRIPGPVSAADPDERPAAGAGGGGGDHGDHQDRDPDRGGQRPVPRQARGRRVRGGRQEGLRI